MISLIPDYLRSIDKELEIRKGYTQDEEIETVYLGGGTPSLLGPQQIKNLLDRIKSLHPLTSDAEITLEANPDDLSGHYLDELADFTPVNRISIGIQSFDDRDLHLLSRRHTAAQAHKSIKQAMHAGFKNISIDLIYGLPGMDVQRWQKNLDLAFSYEIRHLSAYHLTIEPGTAFSRMASRGLLKTADEDESTRQFVALNKTGEENGFEHYEISNLAREGYYSRHNTGYWQRKTYLGIGPAAHSYNIFSRQWNVPDIRKYIAAVNRGYEFYGKEELDIDKRYNEYLMVSLRTNRGVDLKIIQAEFGDQTYQDFLKAIATFVSSGHMIREGLNCKLTKEGWLISDYIISKLATE